MEGIAGSSIAERARASASVTERVRKALDALEEASELLDAVYSGDVHLVRKCSVHSAHRAFVPEVEVSYVEFKGTSHGTRADLRCGHSVWIPPEMSTARGETEPCAYCAQECDWLTQ